MTLAASPYFKHLDGVRTLAVLMVVIHHWVVGNSILHYGGAMGVGLFFVLSGFLITNILLRQQAHFQSINWRGKLDILRVFYIRRTLRIFPIYYLYVSVLVIFGIGASREIWPWLFGYAYNFLLFFTNNWHSGYVEHLWSLAIEEQYYLVWPALLLACPPRYNWLLVITFIALAMVCKAVLYLDAPASQFSKFPVCQFDGFGIGSAIALVWRAGQRIRWAWFWFAAFWGLSFFMKWNVVHFHGKSFLGQVLPLYYIGCGMLIYLAAKGINGPLATFFNNSAVIFLGKISYGIYLYHLFVPDLVTVVFRFFQIPKPPVVGLWLIYSGVTFCICLLSWFGIEQPINRWKDRFKY